MDGVYESEEKTIRRPSNIHVIQILKALLNLSTYSDAMEEIVIKIQLALKACENAVWKMKAKPQKYKISYHYRHYYHCC